MKDNDDNDDNDPRMTFEEFRLAVARRIVAEDPRCRGMSAEAFLAASGPVLDDLIRDVSRNTTAGIVHSEVVGFKPAADQASPARPPGLLPGFGADADAAADAGYGPYRRERRRRKKCR